MRANEAWRNDPVRLMNAIRWYKERSEELEEVESLLSRAYEICKNWDNFENLEKYSGLGAYLATVRTKVWSAWWHMDWWVKNNRDILHSTDTAMFSNAAAFGVGSDN